MGEKNTRYFPGVTTIRRRHNTYEAIQDVDGIWVANDGDLERLVTEYFSNLFYDIMHFVPYCIHGAFPHLSENNFDMFKDRVMSEGARLGKLYFLWKISKLQVRMDFKRFFFLLKPMEYCGGGSLQPY